MLSIILSILLNSDRLGKRPGDTDRSRRRTTGAQRHTLRFWTPALVGAGRSDVFGDGPKLFSGGSSVVGPGPYNCGPSAAGANHPWRVYGPELCTTTGAHNQSRRRNDQYRPPEIPTIKMADMTKPHVSFDPGYGTFMP